jgi:hypothetical protein
MRQTDLLARPRLGDNHRPEQALGVWLLVYW